MVSFYRAFVSIILVLSLHLSYGAETGAEAEECCVCNPECGAKQYCANCDGGACCFDVDSNKAAEKTEIQSINPRAETGAQVIDGGVCEPPCESGQYCSSCNDGSGDSCCHDSDSNRGSDQEKTESIGVSRGDAQFGGPINGYNDKNYIIQLSESTVYIIGVIVGLLLLINISFLCWINCCKSQNKAKYRQVSQIASSDDDMQNFKEYPL